MVHKRKKSAKVARNMRRKKKRGGTKRMTAKVMRNLALKRRAHGHPPSVVREFARHDAAMKRMGYEEKGDI